MTSIRINQLHLILVALTTALLGVSMVLMGHHSHILISTDFFGVSELLSPTLFNAIASGAFIGIAMLALLSLKYSRYQPALGFALIVVCLIPLLSLLSEKMWIENLGGFPAIGSGQGVIKYFALLSIGFMLLPLNLSTSSKKWFAVLPSVLVLLWIGGMKFTLLEAQGIEPLVQSSPLMSWMYGIWDLQMTSNLIGVYDIIALLALLLSIKYKQFLLPGIAMSGAVFVVTQTFLFTWDAALSTETILSTGGHFLIKDIWYISNLIWLYQLNKNQQ